MPRFLAAACAALLLATAFHPTAARAADSACQPPAASEIQALACPKDGKPKGRAGKFDYYALVLGWSPHHCRGKDVTAGDDFQCKANSFGFVVDGLWPIRNSGKQPQYCAGQNVPALPATMVAENMCIMPNASVVQCAWKKEGTCTGLDDDAYFATARKLFAELNIPPEFRQPFPEDRTVQATAFIAEMVAANPGLKPENIALICEGSGVSDAIEKIGVCYDADLDPHPCGRVPDACRSPEIRFFGTK